jgi:hypothetical protein
LWGIDHSYETSDFLNAVFEDEDLLLRCLFNNDSVVFTGNDNQEARYDACDQSEADISYFDRECKEWKSKPNPYHDETKYDYLVLVNKQHKLPEDWESNVDLVETKNAFDETIKVEKEAYEQYLELRDELLKD